MTVWKRSVALLLTLAFVLTAAPGRADQGSDGAALDDFVRAERDRSGVPGVAYAVVGADGVEHAGAVGTDGDGDPVTSSTPFLWGSVSKPVTATLVVLLAADDVLDLDARVVDLLPSFATADPGSSRNITVRQLLDHTSGLPEGLELTDRYDDGRDLDTVVDALVDLEPVADPGAEHSYSSLNYVVLAAVVEEVTGRAYDDVLAERVLGPAGMDATHADAADPADAERVLPAGHRFVLGRARAFESHVDPATVPAGYVVGPIEDLVAFARTQLSGSQLLDDDERALLHTAGVPTGDDSGYALGWRTWHVPGSDEPMVWHGGAAPGYQSAIVLLPERDQAVVVLQNAYGPFQEQQLLDTAWGLAALVIGTEPPRDGVDVTYPVALGLLGAVAVGLLALVGASLVSVLRPVRRPDRPRSMRRRAVGLAATLVGLGLVVLAMLALPGLAGVALGQLGLWAPDLSWLVHAVLLLAPTLALVRIAVTVRALGRGRAA